jgi:hypothetical protein
MRRRRIIEDFMTTAESSPSGQDDDADEAASPPPVAKNSTGFFAAEDDLDLLVSTFPLQSISFNLSNTCSCFQAALTMMMKSLSPRGQNYSLKELSQQRN